MAVQLNYNTTVSEDMAGMDEVVANERTRATVIPVTLTTSLSGAGSYQTNRLGQNNLGQFGPPSSVATSTGSTIAAGDFMTGICTIKANAAAQTFTLDTAANFVTAVNSVSGGALVGDTLGCLIINAGGTNTFTVSLGSNGFADTNQTWPITMPINSSRYFFIRLTNNNVVPGTQGLSITTPSYTAYT